MLNRDKLLQELQLFQGQLFYSETNLEPLIRQGWHLVIEQERLLIDEIARRHIHVSLPLWEDFLGKTYVISLEKIEYAILGVDGSQVYPDRHRGRLNCYIVNIGSVLLEYQDPISHVALSSSPQLFTHDVKSDDYDDAATKDLVDLQREELEFEEGFKQSLEYSNRAQDKPFLCLFDGSFIFWHLESKPVEVKERFLSIYFSSLNSFATHNILVASYISMPRNRELTNLITLVLCSKFKKMGKLCVTGDCACILLRATVDSDIIRLFLKPGERSIVFVSSSYVTREYPKDLLPCFFFMHVGAEIVRVEIPWWVSQKEGAVDTIATLLYDQVIKGDGYPVVLAEAHEQAVVKVQEQEFFYELLNQKAMVMGYSLKPSQKSLKKKKMGI